MENSKECIPFIVFESSMARQERTIKRLVIALIFSFVLAFTSNAIWLMVVSDYEYANEEVTVDGTDGVANYIGNDGDIANGENYSKEKNDDAQKPK